MKQNLLSEDYLVTIGRKVSVARHLRGEKITTLARAMNVSHAVISLIENGRYTSLKVKMIIDICAHLQIPVESVLQ